MISILLVRKLKLKEVVTCQGTQLLNSGPQTNGERLQAHGSQAREEGLPRAGILGSMTEWVPANWGRYYLLQQLYTECWHSCVYTAIWEKSESCILPYTFLFEWDLVGGQKWGHKVRVMLLIGQ